MTVIVTQPNIISSSIGDLTPEAKQAVGLTVGMSILTLGGYLGYKKAKWTGLLIGLGAGALFNIFITSKLTKEWIT